MPDLNYPRRRRVYVSGPFANGDTAEFTVIDNNVEEATKHARALMDAGYSVLCPHLSWYQCDDWRRRQNHAVWLSCDLAWVECAEAVYRVPGESKGADEECEYAKRLGIPVVTSLTQLRAVLPAVPPPSEPVETYEYYATLREDTADDSLPAQDSSDVHEFSTGAVRSKDADAYRFDLVTPIGMEQWIDVEMENLNVEREHLPDEAEEIDRVATREAILQCLLAIFKFLAGDGTPRDLIIAFEYLDIAARKHGEPLMFGVGKAYAEGARKYRSYNWERGMDADAILNHAIRHILLAYEGDTADDHLGHAGWNLLAAYHSLKLWPHLNAGKFRLPGCKPPNADQSTVLSDA